MEEGILEIDGSAFKDCTSLKNITIPKSIQKINGYVFNNCSSLEQIVLPEGLTTINTYMFSGCNMIKEIVVPSSMEKIEKKAFYNCEDIVLVYSGTMAFWNNIEKADGWNDNLSGYTIRCTDGDITG
jgi:hypothetical protein